MTVTTTDAFAGRVREWTAASAEASAPHAIGRRAAAPLGGEGSLGAHPGGHDTVLTTARPVAKRRVGRKGGAPAKEHPCTGSPASAPTRAAVVAACLLAVPGAASATGGEQTVLALGCTREDDGVNPPQIPFRDREAGTRSGGLGRSEAEETTEDRRIPDRSS